MSTTIPSLKDPHFLELQRKIDSESAPIHVEFVPEDNADQLDCFNIVENRVKDEGGRRILGWQIWKSDILIEAEAHAVWEAPSGNIIDISPKKDFFKVDQILFIKDSRLKYQGVQIDSLRLNITSNDLVDLLINMFEFYFFLRNNGKRAKVRDLSKILNQQEINELVNCHVDIHNLTQFVRDGNNQRSLCFCESGKRFKNCHGISMSNKLNAN